MPELPEVETVVRTLRPLLTGQTLSGVKTGANRLRKPWNSSWNNIVSGSTITGIHRRGKWILLDLSRSGYRLIVHLGMTGRLSFQSKAVPKPKHTHLIMPLNDGANELRYCDPRRFGSVTLAMEVNAHHRFPEEKFLGPEPFDLTIEDFRNSIVHSKRVIKAILLDQTVVAGVGNIYADESLFDAHILPSRQGSSLSVEEIKTLRRSVATVLQRAIKSNGSTIVNFYFGDNKTGSFQKEFRVYGRTNQPCRKCKLPIECIRLAGRSTHFCRHCQR